MSPVREPDADPSVTREPTTQPRILAVLHSHFAAPWQYDGDRSAAIGRLVDVATGGAFTGGDAREAISRLDAAGYILGGVAAVVQGEQSGIGLRIRVRARAGIHRSSVCRGKCRS